MNWSQMECVVVEDQNFQGLGVLAGDPAGNSASAGPVALVGPEAP